MQTIALSHLLYMLLPLIVVALFYYKWLDDIQELGYATLRMVSQLLLIGYALTFLFANPSLLLGGAILLTMIAISSMIALRSLQHKSFHEYTILFASIALGGSFNLLIVLVLVLEVEPLYTPSIVIPLAGMIYANAMNTVALSAERFENEIKIHDYETARKIAFKASMIPQINSFLAVGLVSLPGMMTGQILSGVDPLIAVRYQIVVMAMVLGSSGISTILFLIWKKKTLRPAEQ
jgi:putative ABC transport system permease protein